MDYKYHSKDTHFQWKPIKWRMKLLGALRIMGESAPLRSQSFCAFFPCRSLRRFLVIDEAQFILVEPDTTKLGWGVVKFVARLQVSNGSVDSFPTSCPLSRSVFIYLYHRTWRQRPTRRIVDLCSLPSISLLLAGV